MTPLSIIEKDSTLTEHRSHVTVAAPSREDFTRDNGKAAQALAEEYMRKRGHTNVLVSDKNGPFPASDQAATDGDLASGKIAITHWRMDFTFLQRL